MCLVCFRLILRIIGCRFKAFSLLLEMKKLKLPWGKRIPLTNWFSNISSVNSTNSQKSFFFHGTKVLNKDAFFAFLSFIHLFELSNLIYFVILAFSVGSDEYWLIFQTSGTVISKEINAIHTSHDTNLMKRVKSNDFSLVMGIYNSHLKCKVF